MGRIRLNRMHVITVIFAVVVRSVWSFRNGLSRQLVGTKHARTSTALFMISDPLSPKKQMEDSIIKHLFRNTILGSILISPMASVALEGAFELDTKYYIKNLLQLNTQPGELQQIMYPTPRKLDENFTSNLIKLLKTEISNISKRPIEDINAFISTKVPLLLPYFKTKAPITKEDITDQYYFDMIVYTLYLYALNVIPTSEQRVILRNNIGIAILNFIQTNKKGVIIEKQIDTVSQVALFGDNIKRILDLFVTNKVIAGYTIEDENFYDREYIEVSFKEV